MFPPASGSFLFSPSLLSAPSVANCAVTFLLRSSLGDPRLESLLSVEIGSGWDSRQMQINSHLFWLRGQNKY